MGKEIKFRAWDKKENEWAVIDLNSWDSSQMTAVIGDGNEEYPYMQFRVESDDKFEIMQYTGFRDKNDKEIYEGDIIKLKEQSLDGEYYSERYKEIKLIDGLLNGMPIEIYKDIENKLVIEYRPSDCEVVGNIYENPELIKK